MVFTLFLINISYASDCTKACSAEGRPYIDTKVSDEKFFLFNYCQLRCNSSNFACRDNLIPDDVRRLKNDANWASNCKAMSDEAFTQKRKDEIQGKRAAEKERVQERIRENDRKHQENMEAIRNQQNQAAAAQVRTQTSQNNYPSDSTYDSSNSSSQSSGSDTSDDANRCVKVTQNERGYSRFTNSCNFTINIYWCVDRECVTNNGRLERFKPGSSYPVMAEPEQDYKFGACPDPYGIDHRSASGGFNGNFTCRR